MPGNCFFTNFCFSDVHNILQNLVGKVCSRVQAGEQAQEEKASRMLKTFFQAGTERHSLVPGLALYNSQGEDASARFSLQVKGNHKLWFRRFSSEARKDELAAAIEVVDD